MTLKAAILTALPPESIRRLAEATWPDGIDNLEDEPASEFESARVAEWRQRLRRSPRVTLADTLETLNKESLITICRVLGLDHRGRRAELTARLLELDARTRPKSRKTR
jgi:hypothetical protein